MTRSSAAAIEIGERVPIPDGLVPPDASVEMEAKKAAGYYTPEGAPSEEQLKGVVGRDLGNSEARLPASRAAARSEAGRAIQCPLAFTRSPPHCLGTGGWRRHADEAIRSLLSAAAVRERAHEMLALALAGEVEGWAVDLGRLDDAADADRRR